MPTTPLTGLPYPNDTDGADGPAAIKALAQAVELALPVTVPDRSSRDALTAVNGKQVFQADVGLSLIRVGSAWRLMRPQTYINDGMIASQGLNSQNWLGTDYAWVPAMGSKIVIPADGIARDCIIHGQVSILQDGWTRLRVDISNASVPFYSHNVHSGADAEERVAVQMNYFHNGSGVSTIYMEAKSTVAATADFWYPSLSVVAR